MFARLIAPISIAVLLSACATSHENPNYEYSTRYEEAKPVQYAAAPAQTQTAAPITHQASYQAQPATYTRVNHECLNKETNRELLGAGIGAVAGGVIGHETVGGTKGTVIGAAIGGAAGYGIADKSINCDPVAVPITQPQAVISPAYNPAAETPTYRYASVAGTEQSLGLDTAGRIEAPTDAASDDTFGTPGYHAVQSAENGIATTDEAIIPVRPKIYVSNAQANQTSANEAYSVGAYRHEIIEGDTVYSLSKQRCVEMDAIRQLNNLNAEYSIRLGDYLNLPASQCPAP